MTDFSNVAIQSVRDYWNRRPCNIRHSIAEIGTKEYFDQVEARKYMVEPHIPAFAEFEKWRGKKVLEIGCGIGTDTMNFARAGAQVTEIARVEITKKHIDGPQGVRGRNSDNTKLREVLGWEPGISLEEGLKGTYQWIESQVEETLQKKSETAAA